VLRAELQKNLGCALGAMGRYAEARTALEASLATAKELGESREIAITNGHLGTLAMEQGDLLGAISLYTEALSYFQRLNEPASETFYWHQLGMVFRRSGQLDEAEKAYRESTRIAESQGNFFGAANSWHSLAQLNENAGKYQAAEDWYQKAMQAQRRIGDQVGLSWTLMNLSDLLQNQSGRLAEAQQLAEESLAIKKTLHSGEAKIWVIYDILARIADKQNNSARAQEYRRQAHAALRTFPVIRHQLQEHMPLISAVVATVGGHREAWSFVSKQQKLMRDGHKKWANLAQAIDLILIGQRDAYVLSANLDDLDLPSLIIESILEGIKDPTTLEALLDCVPLE